MTAREVLDHFKRTYPGKNIVCLPEDNPTEIICEVDPSSEHPEYNVAIAAIKQSAPHHHLEATETYKVLDGDLELIVDGESIKLSKGDTHDIKPPQVHSARGNFTIVEVSSMPGWTAEDHILV